MGRALTEAERLRAHGEAFRLAQEMRCTPKEAEAELARRAAQARWQEVHHRLRAKMDAPPRQRASADLAEQPDERWMMRN